MHTNPQSTAGLILSLAATLPRNAPLARRARHCASRLDHGASERAMHASDLLCDLLRAADTDQGGYELDGCLDQDFDS